MIMKKIIFFLMTVLLPLEVLALNLESEVISNKGYIPDRYTCDAQDFSPPLFWSKAPVKTKSFVLICDDPDAPFQTWVHWVVFNIPIDVSRFKENVSKEELSKLSIISGVNDFDKLIYKGPCPPAPKPHRYFFKLYALDIMLPLKEGATKSEVIKAMQGHILAEAQIIGLYQRKEKEDGKD